MLLQVVVYLDGVEAGIADNGGSGYRKPMFYQSPVEIMSIDRTVKCNTNGLGNTNDILAFYCDWYSSRLNGCRTFETFPVKRM